MEKEKILVEVKQFERELQMQNKVLAALNTVDDVKLVVIENELLDMFKKKLNMKLKAWVFMKVWQIAISTLIGLKKF